MPRRARKARINPKERARTRVLSDDELRIIWPELIEAGTFGALVQTLLLTAQRRDEVAQLTRKEIGSDGIWTIPADRYKTKNDEFRSVIEGGDWRHRGAANDRSKAITYFRRVQDAIFGVQQEQSCARQGGARGHAEAREERGEG